MAGAVVLLSGGLDSAVNFKCAVDSPGVIIALTADYGQRSADREIKAAGAMCARYGVVHEILGLPWLGVGSEAAILTQGRLPPELDDMALDDTQGAAARSAEAVWVPNRNGVLVNVAAAFAEQCDASEVVAGFNAEEGATFPDNTPEFVKACNASLALSTRGKVRLRCDTLDMTKSDIVQLGLRIDAPMDLSWPCYLGNERLCGRCESCRRFARAVRQADAEPWFRERHSQMPQ